MSSGALFMSTGLLQLAAVWADRQTHAASTVGAECCSKADHRSQTSRPHHTDIASTSLAASQTTSGIQDCQLAIPTAIKQKLPSYLADDIHLSWQRSARSLKSSWGNVFRVVLVTDVLLQLDLVSGTIYLPACETKSAPQNSGDNQIHSRFKRTVKHRDFFDCCAL